MTIDPAAALDEYDRLGREARKAYREYAKADAAMLAARAALLELLAANPAFECSVILNETVSAAPAPTV